MTPERACDIIRGPIITEKTTALSALDQYAFRVARDATKPEIAEALRILFSVEVRRVNTINVKGKVKRFRGRVGRRAGVKKAIVTLVEGQNLGAMTGM